MDHFYNRLDDEAEVHGDFLLLFSFTDWLGAAGTK